MKRLLNIIVNCFCLFLMWACSDRLSEYEAHLWVQTETDPFFQKDGLKILDIGNSYTDDATALLPLLVKSADIDLRGMSLFKAVRGGSSFKTWCDVYNDCDSTGEYSVNKVIGDLDSGVPEGRGSQNDGTLFRRLLTDVSWDLIFIHQLSTYAPYYDQWKTEEDGGYLEELMSIIKKHQPNAKIGFVLVHSYSSDYSGNKEKSSFLRWKLISESVRRMCEDYGIQYVIPYGTAVQNLRSSSLNDEYDLTRDGTHCGIGLCRYTAACCYYECVIAPRTGISVLGNPACFDAPVNPDYNSSIDVTTQNAPIAQKSAILAKYNWFICLNPEIIQVNLFREFRFFHHHNVIH